MSSSRSKAIPQRNDRASLSADDVELLLRRRPGLLVGPSLTCGSGFVTELVRHLGERCGDQTKSGLLTMCDALVGKGVPAEEFRKHIRSYVEQIRPGRSVGLIAESRWSAVLSALYDSHFEQAFRRWCDRSVTRPTVTTVTDYRQAIPPHTIPVYRLLGSVGADDFVATSNDYRVRQQQWHRVMRDFANIVQGAPMLCLGMADCPWVLLDLLAVILSDPLLDPGPVLLLQDDPIAANDQILDLADRGLRLMRADVTLSGFISVLDRSAKAGYTPKLAFEKAEQSSLEQLGAFSDLVVVVNACSESHIGQDETHRLRDLLFSPTAPHWDPYVHDLDFQRTITPELIRQIQEALTVKNRPLSGVVIRGASANGKTTIMKRAALELSRENYLVLWFRPYFFQDGPSQMRKLFGCIADTQSHNDRRMAVFIDDPLGLGTVKLNDVQEAVEQASLEAVIIVGTRSIEVATSDSDLSLGPNAVIKEVEIPETFDDDEWKALPGYLARLGAYRSLDDARSSVSRAPGRGTRDVLGMLFWLLPETRQRITESVRDEYLRLGDRAAFSRVILGEFNVTSHLLKEAYSFVTVADKYGVPTPIEVLVSSLGVSYEEWLAACIPEGLLWGLLYQEESREAQTTVYRTRNAVVTDIIVEVINGGKFSHARELDKLEHLLSSCDGNAPAYREFCIRVLVPNSRGELAHLEFEEGNLLYEKAIAALYPFEDRTLVHHKGLWEKNKGHDPLRARETLELALETRVYPYTSKGEATEHIYTSLAANELDAIEHKRVSPAEGKQNALTYLERAKSEQFVNSNAVHVQARLIAKLADLTGTTSDPDWVHLIDTALADVDRALLMLKSDFSPPELREDVRCLEQARSEILDRCVALEQMEKDAELQWEEYRRQDGFVLAARKRYARAAASNKGKDFNRAFEYCSQVRNQVSEAGEHVSRHLAEVTLHTYFHWRVRRGSMSGGAEPIDWSLIHSLAYELISADALKRDPYYRYLLALAECHLGNWAEADAIFEELRARRFPPNILWEPRDYLMEEAGSMRRVQGVVRKGPGRDYLHVEDLHTDVLLDRYEKWPREGEIDHAYVRFRFAGPIGVHEP